MSRKFKSITIITISLFFSLLSCKDTGSEQKIITKEIEFSNDGRLTVYKQDTEEAITTFKIETAIGAYETETGLMYRKTLPRDSGMLFLFEEEKPRAFYMKNTIIELDIIYINADKRIVKIHRKATPYDPTSLPSIEPVQYVLEVNGAVTSSYGIEEGDRVEWQLKDY